MSKPFTPFDSEEIYAYYDQNGPFETELRTYINNRIPLFLVQYDDHQMDRMIMDIHFRQAYEDNDILKVTLIYPLGKKRRLPNSIRVGLEQTTMRRYIDRDYDPEKPPASQVASMIKELISVVSRDGVKVAEIMNRSKSHPDTKKQYFNELKIYHWLKRLSIHRTLKESINDILLEEEKTLYLCRKIKNGADIIAWAKTQGFKSTLPEDELHVTIINTDDEIEWTECPDAIDEYHNKGGKRSVEVLGAKGAVVLHITSPELQQRNKEFKKIGATSKFPTYKPHVTITYELGDVDLSEIKPFTGTIEFGPEEFTEAGTAPRIEEIKITEDVFKGGPEKRSLKVVISRLKNA